MAPNFYPPKTIARNRLQKMTLHTLPTKRPFYQNNKTTSRDIRRYYKFLVIRSLQKEKRKKLKTTKNKTIEILLGEILRCLHIYRMRQSTIETRTLLLSKRGTWVACSAPWNITSTGTMYSELSNRLNHIWDHSSQAGCFGRNGYPITLRIKKNIKNPFWSVVKLI